MKSRWQDGRAVRNFMTDGEREVYKRFLPEHQEAKMYNTAEIKKDLEEVANVEVTSHEQNDFEHIFRVKARPGASYDDIDMVLEETSEGYPYDISPGRQKGTATIRVAKTPEWRSGYKA